MKLKSLIVSAVGCAAVSLALPAGAALITFDDLVGGATSYGYDGDGDGIADAVFSTSDPAGFNTSGPGTNMLYIQQPGIEGTTLLSPDLRVDFLKGAIGSLGFGFAMSAGVGGAPTSVTFSVFDATNALLASTTVDADYTATPLGQSNFPEGLVSLVFAGTASHAIFDFDPTNASRYIIDNFTGTFGSTERIPEPATLALAGLGLAALGWRRRSQA